MKSVLIFLCLVAAIVSKSLGKFTLPRILQNTTDCPLNPCEIVKVFSQYLPQKQHQAQQKDSHSEEYSFALEKRLMSVERRLRSIEQPMWKLKAGNSKAWDHCTEEGSCRCEPSTKSLSCWRKDLKQLPPVAVPMDVLSM